MKFKDKEERINLEDEVFKVDGSDFNDGWLWWFWLFFIDDPSKVEKPRQVAILWSKKDEKSVICNGRKFEFEAEEGSEGVVASWYFDGEEMHHNFLLEKCDMKIDPTSLKTEDGTSTSFRIEGDICEVKIGDDFHFTAEPTENYDFAINSRSSGEYLFGMNYSILRSNYLELGGEVKDEDVEGSAYFQRVVMDMPTPGWYWGLFHFENGAFLDYQKIDVLGKPLKEDLAFYDGEETYEFDVFSVDMQQEDGDELPSFQISAETEDGNKEINFTVNPYSKASWKFQKKIAKIIPNELTYREYPARITRLKFVDRENDKEVTLEDLGSSVGNAEYTTGLLL